MRLAILAVCFSLFACTAPKAAAPQKVIRPDIAPTTMPAGKVTTNSAKPVILDDTGVTKPAPKDAEQPKGLRIAVPSEDWSMVPPEQIPEPFQAAILNVKTGAFIGFAGLAGTPKDVMEKMHAAGAKSPNMTQTKIEVSEDGTYASFGFVVSQDNVVKGAGRLGARTLAGLPKGIAVFAEGHWKPAAATETEKQFIGILLSLRFE